MSFANPIYFSLIIFIAFVVLLYFFRKQYHTMINPSNLLWREAMNEWKASFWLQKIQHNLLFWLQIAALTLLMLALVKPLWLSEGTAGEQIIWIVDTSATMSAGNGHQSLLDQAKKQMKQLANRLDGQEVTMIKAEEKPKLLLNRETNPNIIGRTIDQLKVTYEHENIEKAVKLAESYVQKKETVIHIFSDSLKKEDVTVGRGDVSYEIHNTGGIDDNVSIQSFGVSSKQKQISGLAVIENQGKRQKSFPFIVKSEDSTLFQQEITLPAGKQTVINVPNLPERRYYQAMINAHDQYPVDNDVTALYTNMKPPVYALGELNPFFIKGLNTLGIESVQLDGASASDIKENGIVIAEGIPINQLPKMPAIYINKYKKQEKAVELQEAIKSTNSPLLKYVDITKTYIKFAAIPPPGDWDNLVMSGRQPLIQSGMNKGQPVIVLNFSLEDSDWPLHPGFPIFLYNSYQWLSRETGFLGYFQPGEEKWLQLEKNRGNLEIFTAAGKSLTSLQLDKQNFKAPFTPGIYQAVSDGQVYHFSVLLDDREKKLVLRSVQSFKIDAKLTQIERTWRQRDSLWFFLTAIALLVLMAEWEVYRRWL